MNMAVVAGGALLGPLSSYLLHFHWSGAKTQGVPHYLLGDYHAALWLIPLCYLIATLTAQFCIRETHPIITFKRINMIWKAPLDLETLNRRSNNTMASFCQIQFIAYDDNSLTARMPVNDHTQTNRWAILHGGASCVLAETVGSTAANFCVDPDTHYCVGLSIGC